MAILKLGYDDNLGLPADLPAKLGCEIIPYHDLDDMLAAYNNAELTAMFIPAGTLPYVKNYEVICQALFGPSHGKLLTSNFVTGENISLTTISTHTLGRVNKYCTTSFWSPLISLADKLPANTQLNFIDTNGFKDMLLKTAAETVDCSMVWDIFLKNNPDAASKVHQLFSKNDLPTPIIVGNGNLPNDWKAKLSNFISNDSKAFFPGFQSADEAALDKFINDMNKAAEHFNLVIK